LGGPPGGGGGVCVPMFPSKISPCSLVPIQHFTLLPCYPFKIKFYLLFFAYMTFVLIIQTEQNNSVVLFSLVELKWVVSGENTKHGPPSIQNMDWVHGPPIFPTPKNTIENNKKIKVPVPPLHTVPPVFHHNL